MHQHSMRGGVVIVAVATFRLDLQIFAIDQFTPPIQQVIVQLGFLERAFREFIEPTLGYDKITSVEPIEARIGESKTITRPAILPPITVDATPIAAGTDLNQGMTPQNAGYEQFQVVISKMKGMMNLSLEMDYTKIASEFMLNWERLGIQAGQSLDVRAALRVFQGYDGGNTFATAVNTAQTSIHVDNVNGFLTQYQVLGTAGLSPLTLPTANASPGVPQPVSTTNKLPIQVFAIANPTNAPQSANVIGITVDGSNTSTAQSGSIAYGQSGTLLLDAAVTTAVGDQLKALDGSYVIRPNGKLTRQQLAGTDTVLFQNFTKARAKLANRKVPTIRGRYIAFVDAELMADLQLDPAFRQATQGNFGSVNPYFSTGIVAPAFGLEFVETTTNPVYATATPGLVARHAMVMGASAIIKAPFKGSLDAARQANNMPGPVDLRIEASSSIIMISRAPIDVEGDTVNQVWRFTGGHVLATDITSTPAQIQTTDLARYKRGILVEAASAA